MIFGLELAEQGKGWLAELHIFSENIEKDVYTMIN